MADPASSQVEVKWPDEGLWPQAGYGNAFAINHTPWDFTVRIGHVVFPPVSSETVEKGETITVAAIPVAEITFAPEALRQLSDAIVQQLQRYEETYHTTESADDSEEGAK